MTDEAYRQIRERELTEGGWSPSQRDNKIREEIAEGKPAERGREISRRAADFEQEQGARRREKNEDAKRRVVAENAHISALFPAAGLGPDDFITKMKEKGITTTEGARDLLRDLMPPMEDTDFEAIEAETDKIVAEEAAVEPEPEPKPKEKRKRAPRKKKV